MSRFNFLFPWKRLHQLGIMGLNERNADFILPYNPRRYYPLVDNKAQAKVLAKEVGIPVPDLYGSIEIIHQIEQLTEWLSPYEDFVIKPAHGAGGEGILIITGRHDKRYRKTNGAVADIEELRHHVANILGGMYSLGGIPDSALIEYRVKFDPVFEPISFQGVPDIRILVFMGIPVLAMIRLPTRMSHGKANLHQGAVGVGIDMTTGCTLGGVWRDAPVDHHPDTGGTLSDRTIPFWEDILSMAAQCYDLVGLGFIGVDIVIDQQLGPMMLEINARPGLSIQLANRTGLLSRLRRIQEIRNVPTPVYERVQLAKYLSQ